MRAFSFAVARDFNGSQVVILESDRSIEVSCTVLSMTTFESAVYLGEPITS